MGCLRRRSLCLEQRPSILGAPLRSPVGGASGLRTLGAAARSGRRSGYWSGATRGSAQSDERENQLPLSPLETDFHPAADADAFLKLETFFVSCTVSSPQN